MSILQSPKQSPILNSRPNVRPKSEPHLKLSSTRWQFNWRQFNWHKTWALALTILAFCKSLAAVGSTSSVDDAESQEEVQASDPYVCRGLSSVPDCEEVLFSQIQALAPEAIVVLGASVTPGINLGRRIRAAARLAASLGKVAPTILLTGGNPTEKPRVAVGTEALCTVQQCLTEPDSDRCEAFALGKPVAVSEAVTMCRILVTEFAVPVESLILEGRASSTIGNARFSVPLLSQFKFKSALILTTTSGESNHAARALNNFETAQSSSPLEQQIRFSAVSWPYSGGPPAWLRSH
jgi:uncharacterized SAM-binding protein YcdF (DUF218 family)